MRFSHQLSVQSFVEFSYILHFLVQLGGKLRQNELTLTQDHRYVTALGVI